MLSATWNPICCAAQADTGVQSTPRYSVSTRCLRSGLTAGYKCDSPSICDVGSSADVNFFEN